MSELIDERSGPRVAVAASLIFVRFALPALIVLSGTSLAIIGARESALEAGALLIGAVLSVALGNLLYRVGVRGYEDRRREELARERFDRTGRWPSE